MNTSNTSVTADKVGSSKALNINNRIEVRKATQHDINAIRAQMRECIAVQVAILGGESFVSQLQLANALEVRSKELERLIHTAEAGEPLEFDPDGGVPVPAY